MSKLVKISFVMALLALSACNKPAGKEGEAKGAAPIAAPAQTAEPKAEAKAEEAKAAEEPKAPEIKEVVIGGKTWMAANLAVTVDRDGKKVTCYADTAKDADFVKKYGCLYKWAEAKNICPAGWHLPTKADFESLLKASGSNNNKKMPNPAFQALVAKEPIWQSEHSDKATNSSAFGALPAGHWNGTNYDLLGSFGYFMSATEYEEEEADCIYILNLGEGFANVINDDRAYAYSVRCIKD